jgi:hypothetical protein
MNYLVLNFLHTSFDMSVATTQQSPCFTPVQAIQPVQADQADHSDSLMLVSGMIGRMVTTPDAVVSTNMAITVGCGSVDVSSKCGGCKTVNTFEVSGSITAGKPGDFILTNLGYECANCNCINKFGGKMF